MKHRLMTDTITHWHGCYDDSWKGTITDEAFAHPAKFSKGLIERIADHLSLPRGGVVVDPFGGVGLGGIVFASRGVQWIGCELEEKFVKLAEQNFELHRRTWEGFGDPLPEIVQGDSRRLREHVLPVVAWWSEQGADCVVSSPPFHSVQANSQTDYSKWESIAKNADGSNRLARSVQQDGYGQTPGQLGNMKPGEVDAVVSSPPFMEQQTGGGIFHTGTPAMQQTGGGPSGTGGYRDQGTTPGQLGNMKSGEVDAVVTSPPFIDQVPQQDKNFSAPHDSTNHLKGDYGQTPGQLGNMKSGEVDAVVSSPPYEGSLASDDPVKRGGLFRDPKCEKDKTLTAEYGNSDGQLGQESGDTFWAAARDIVAECHAILKPGGLAVWVTKDFVRKGQRVPFSDDWERLCVSCGFESVERIHAQLVKRDSHPSLFGGEETTTKERKSFFRRLAESKGSPAIDHEDVIVMRKK